MNRLRKNKEQLFARVVLVGDSGVGKTSIIRKYTENIFNQDATITTSK